MGPLLGAVRVLLVAQSIQGIVAGRVLETETAKPVAGAAVTITDLGRSTAADDSGRYVFRGVPPGRHELAVRSVGYAKQSLEALVPSDEPLELSFELVPEPLPMRAIDVRAPLVGPLPQRFGRFPDREISLAGIENHPLLAETDALQALDGGLVALRPESPSGVSLHGGASDQTAYALDGIPILNPYHAAGIASAWNPDALSTLSVASSLPSGSQPNALSGAIEATTRTPGNQFRAIGSMSTTQSRVTVDGPLQLRSNVPDADAADPTEPAAGAGYLLSIRSGLPDLMAPRDESSYIRGEIGDWLAKIEMPALEGRLRLLGYGNENDLNTAVEVAPDEGNPADLRRNTFEWNSQSLGAAWTRAFPVATLRLAGWRADTQADSRWRSGGGPLAMGSSRHDAGVLATLERGGDRIASTVQLRYDVSRTRYRVTADSTSLPSMSLKASVPVVTASASHDRAIGRSVEMGIGFTGSEAGSRWRFGPNARLQWKASRSLDVFGSYARSHQFAQSLRNAESVVGNVFPADIAAASNGGVPVSRSDLGVLALTARPRSEVEIGVQTYARRSNEILLVAPGEPEPFATRPFTTGSSHSLGASVEAAWTSPRWIALLRYGWQQTRNEYAGGRYTPESNPRHALVGGVTLLPSASLTVRLHASVAWHRLAVPIADGFEWESTNILDRGSEFGGSPHYSGALEAIGLPAYARVDLGLRKTWRLRVGGRDAAIAAFGSATNILGRKNVLTYARNESTGRLEAIEMRPPSPLVVGLDWEF